MVDKPKGMTSHDVIDRVRRITGEKKVGHAGTLDPNATGLLIIGVGRESTKKLGDIAKNTSKTYDAEIILGEERDTDDAEGVPVQVQGTTKLPTLPQIEAVLKSFEGELMQVPPAYSALKIKGKPAYRYARKGQKIELKPRKVVIRYIKLVNYEYPNLFITTSVSSGTYIRSLAKDIGKKLGVGAYLNNLRRTKIGIYEVKKAIKLDKLNKSNINKYTI